MVNYREILRLRSLGYSITQISAAVHSSRSTIRDVYQRAEASISKKDRTVRRSRGITRGAEQFREGGDLK